MIVVERQSRLQQIVAQRGMADVETLSAELGVSSSTIRRDLEALEQQGLVKRTHGGVVWVGEKTPAGAARPYAFDQRMGYRNESKLAIARAARHLVQPGQTVLIDGGTTTFYLANELLAQEQPLQLVTNSLPIANLFLNNESVELILTGGLMYPRYGVLLGPQAEETIGTIHTKTLFFSVAGIHDGALYNQNVLLVNAERQMMRQSQEVVLLADSGKFGQQALARLCDLSEVDVVVTDAGIEAGHRAMIEKAGCRVIVAE
ncbi:MAG TPA: DeoR/GlpR family DNA-binding transcription regulator [Tepidisphaeraceae bacterium]|nr:DeoR/GlpR family DNA-binding transcription regulator [Tepidisphaeraceae bacterium]